MGEVESIAREMERLGGSPSYVELRPAAARRYVVRMKSGAERAQDRRMAFAQNRRRRRCKRWISRAAAGITRWRTLMLKAYAAGAALPADAREAVVLRMPDTGALVEVYRPVAR